MANFHAGRPAAWIEVTGEDAFPFLQGQFSNDLRGGHGKSTYGLWLNRKGKVLADSFVCQAGADRFFLLSYDSPSAVILERLDSFIIADDVTLSDHTGNASLLSIWGADAADLLNRTGTGVPETDRAAFLDTGAVFRGRRSRAGSFEVVFQGAGHAMERDRLVERLISSGAVSVSEGELQAERFRSRIPGIPVDIGPDDLPQEGGLELEALSFGKGCYLGQEVMARLHAMGQVRRVLTPVMVRAPRPPPLKTSLFAGDKLIGEIRSLIGSGPFEGFAMIHRNALAETSGFSLSAGGETEVFVVDIQ